MAKRTHELGFVNDSKTQVTSDERRIILTPIRDEFTLEGLLSQCKGSNPHPEHFAGAIGMEAL